MIITPTVGRIVWIRRAGQPRDAQPDAAIVTHVYDDRCIAVAVFSYRPVEAPGILCHFNAYDHIPLVQEGDPLPTEGIYAEWMPYQIGQAKRHSQEAPSDPAKGYPLAQFAGTAVDPTT